jgi:hypothetical protein
VSKVFGARLFGGRADSHGDLLPAGADLAGGSDGIALQRDEQSDQLVVCG